MDFLPRSHIPIVGATKRLKITWNRPKMWERDSKNTSCSFEGIPIRFYRTSMSDANKESHKLQVKKRLYRQFHDDTIGISDSRRKSTKERSLSSIEQME